jgi:L-aspartate oxidase
MWRNVGIVRRGDRLRETCDILDFWGHYTLDKTFDDGLGWETQNKLTVARLIALSALERTDSIGVHFRSDATSDQERIREPLSPAGGEGRVRGFRDVPQTSANYHVTVTRDADGTKPARVPVGA